MIEPLSPISCYNEDRDTKHERVMALSCLRFTMLVVKNNFWYIKVQYYSVSLLFPTCPAAYTRPFDFSLWNAQVMFSMNIYKRRAWDEFLRSCWLVNKGNQSFDIIQVYWKGANWSIRSQTEFCRYESHTRKETVVSTIVVFCINFHSNSFSSHKITASGYFSIITKKHRA